MTKIEELIISKAKEEEKSYSISPLVSISKGVNSAYGIGFIEGAEWMNKQNPWRNFKDERPKPDSHILRRMIHPGYRTYGEVIYYADFWNSDRSDEWKQEDDRVVCEWQYINN